MATEGRHAGLPCLRSRRMDELCRSSTFSRTAVGVMRCWLRTPVELLQSSYTSGTTVRQGSRFAPTLPYQTFNPFGVGELRGDGWHFRKFRAIRVKKTCEVVVIWRRIFWGHAEIIFGTQRLMSCASSMRRRRCAALIPLRLCVPYKSPA